MPVRHLDAELAQRLVKRRLAPPEYEQWERHLEACAPCRKLVDEERRLSNLLKLCDESAGPVGAYERALARIAALAPRRAAKRRRQKRLTAVGYVAAAALIVAVAWSFRSATRETERVAATLGISAATQRDVLSKLAALDTLRREPWIPDDLAAAQTMNTLIERNRTAP